MADPHATARTYYVPMDSLREGSTLRDDPPWPSRDVVLRTDYEALAADLAAAHTRAEAAEAVIAAARVENDEAHYGGPRERTRAILNNALLDYDTALASVGDPAKETT